MPLDPEEKKRREVAREAEREKKRRAREAERRRSIYRAIVRVARRENRAVTVMDVCDSTDLSPKIVRRELEEMRLAGVLWRLPVLSMRGRRTGRDAMKGEPDQIRRGYLPVRDPKVDPLRIGQCEGTGCENVPVIVVCGKRLCRTCSRGDVRSGDTFRDAADETERDRAARYGGYSSSQRAGGWEPTDTYNLLREQDPEGPERPKRQPPRPRGRPRTAIPCQ